MTIVDRILLSQLIIFTILIISVKPECKITNYCNCTSIDNNERYYFCEKNSNVTQIIVTVKKTADEKNIQMECKNYIEPDYVELIADMSVYLLPNKKNSLEIKFCSFPNVSFVEILNVFDKEHPITEFIFTYAKAPNLTPFHLENLTSVEILRLPYNKFETLPEELFKNMPNLRELHLNGNYLRSLPGNIFDPLENLILLNIHDNKLTSIDGRIFKNLSSLRTLSLNNNKLDNLSSSTFSSLIGLTDLNLSSNDMKTLNDGIFDNLENLSSLNLNSNQLSGVPETPFVHNSKLITIQLKSAFNKTNFRLPSRFFTGQKSLKELYLSSNNLSSLPEEIFQYDRRNSLEKLDLSHNRLSGLHNDSFCDLTELKVLKINKNDLKNVTEQLFEGLGALQKLDLSYNQLISNTEESPIHQCNNLIEVNLSHNLLTKIYRDWRESLENLKILDISYNELENLTTEDFKFKMTEPPRVDCSHNKITSINLTGIEKYKNKSPVIFYINNNPIKCDCKALTLVEYLRKNDSGARIIADDLNCIGPKSLENQSLKTVDVMHLKCPLHEIHPELKDSCPKTCDCSYRPKGNALEVNCTSRGMTIFPEEIPITNYDVELLLDENNLTSVDGILNLSEKVRNRVIKLSLSNNKLENIEDLKGLNGLKTLTLDNNQLTKLDDELYNHFKGLQNLTMITLHNNPWICNCETIPLWRLIRDDFQHKILYKDSITCPGNPSSINHLAEDELCDRTRHQAGKNLILILGLLIALVNCVLICIYCTCKHEIKVWMFARKWLRWLVTEKEIDRDKKYDAFVSFSHKDQDFVDKHLIPQLEENNEENYKLCIHYRDFLPGAWIPEQITSSVENSRRTIIVLSPNFLQSYWGQLEWKTAHLQAVRENRARVIIIMYQPVKPEDLDHELRTYITMNTYLEWGSKFFWKNLKFALGLPVKHLKKHITDVDMEPLRETRIGP